MAHKAQGWIRQFHKPASETVAPLLICPHAGAGASAYRNLSRILSERFAVTVVQYPGRQDRIDEPAATSIAEMATGALAELRESHYTGAPITVFGHSIGAVVAFELVRAAEAAGVSVRLLIASAAVAPVLVEAFPAHPTEDDPLLDWIATLNGTDADVLADRELMRMALPALKADYRAFDSYSCAEAVRIRTGIRVVGGNDDPIVTPADLRAWQMHTRGDFRMTLFDGGHFYLEDNATELVQLLAADLELVP